MTNSPMPLVVLPPLLAAQFPQIPGQFLRFEQDAPGPGQSLDTLDFSHFIGTQHLFNRFCEVDYFVVVILSDDGRNGGWVRERYR
jgi:hypothetical protein